MSIQVRETPAGKSIAAHIVLNPKGKHVATVQVAFGNSGLVRVDVWNKGDEATRKTALAMGYTLDESGRVATFNGKPTKHAGAWPYEVAGLQQGTAGGGGYDKFTAALSGLYIDGHAMTDHCGAKLKRPNGRLWQDSDRVKLKRKGYTLANYQSNAENPAASGYMDAFRLSGLDYLKAIGYRVIQAI